jgi:hypothetical protein
MDAASVFIGGSRVIRTPISDSFLPITARTAEFGLCVVGLRSKWNDPLNWHTRDGHTLWGRGSASAEKKALFAEVPAHDRRAHEDLRERR